MYALYFLLVTVICVIMMSPTVEQQMRDHVSTPVNKSLNTVSLFQLQVWLDCSEQYKKDHTQNR